MAHVNIKQLRKTYDGRADVLAGLNLDIRDGEFCVLVGPSGCGKSTLLRMLCGLEEISGGELAIGGQVVNHLPPAERGIAMVFQSYALYPHMNVYKNMAFGLKVAGSSKSEIDRASAMRPRSSRSITCCSACRASSGGQRQRVAIGRAIVRSRACSCSTSRCRTSTRRCGCRPGWRSPSCTGNWRPPSSTSPTTRSRP
jgi:multiple sugar transport system ATP-binding protein